MNLLTYLKEKGVKHAFKVFYEYKIDKIIQKVLLFFLKNQNLKDIIVIESHNDFDCNGGAFYDYLIENNFNLKYKIVWLIKNKLNKELPKNVVAVPLFKPSIMKNYYLCTAKILTFDCNLMTKLRNDQKVFYFTHGAVSLKNVKGKMNIPENLDYYCSPSEFYTPIICNMLDLKYPNDMFVHLGIPCHDILFQPIVNSELRKLVQNKFNNTILWMPTFRKGTAFQRNDSNVEFKMGIPIIENEDMYNELNELLKLNNSLLIIKIHPMQDLSTLKVNDMSNIKVLTGESVKKYNIDNYRLMKEMDALISDYSSAAYDFLLLNRPIGYVLSDAKDYKLGFIVDDPHELMAGDEINTFGDLKRFISNVSNGVDVYFDKRVNLCKTLFKYRDGKTCQRYVEFMGLEK